MFRFIQEKFSFTDDNSNPEILKSSLRKYLEKFRDTGCTVRSVLPSTSVSILSDERRTQDGARMIEKIIFGRNPRVHVDVGIGQWYALPCEEWWCVDICSNFRGGKNERVTLRFEISVPEDYDAVNYYCEPNCECSAPATKDGDCPSYEQLIKENTKMTCGTVCTATHIDYGDLCNCPVLCDMPLPNILSAVGHMRAVWYTLSAKEIKDDRLYLDGWDNTMPDFIWTGPAEVRRSGRSGKFQKAADHRVNNVWCLHVESESSAKYPNLRDATSFGENKWVRVTENAYVGLKFSHDLKQRLQDKEENVVVKILLAWKPIIMCDMSLDECVKLKSKADLVMGKISVDAKYWACDGTPLALIPPVPSGDEIIIYVPDQFKQIELDGRSRLEECDLLDSCSSTRLKWVVKNETALVLRNVPQNAFVYIYM